jgi:hypothetical protein
VVEPVRRGEADVVYGSRYLSVEERHPWSKYRVAVSLLNAVVRLLYRTRLTDEATCYKVMRTQLMRNLELQSTRFEFCAEITAKVCRLRLGITEVPISYHPRSQKEGKKIGWRDAWQTLWTLFKWRFLPVRLRHDTDSGADQGPSPARHVLRW